MPRMARLARTKAGVMKGSVKCLVLAAALVPVLALAASWWNNDWKYRKEIGFDLIPGRRRHAARRSRTCRCWCACRSRISATSTIPSPTARIFAWWRATTRRRSSFTSRNTTRRTRWPCSGCACRRSPAARRREKIYAYYGNPDAPAAADVPGTYDTAQILVLSFSDGQRCRPRIDGIQEQPVRLHGGAVAGVASSAAARSSPARKASRYPRAASLRLLPSQGFTASAWLRVEQAQQARGVRARRSGQVRGACAGGRKARGARQFRRGARDGDRDLRSRLEPMASRRR